MKKIICIVSVLILFSFNIKAQALAPSAKGAVVISADTGEIIYLKNSDVRLPMASTTKIMTSLLLCEYGNLNKQITVTEEMVRVEGSSMGLLAGDTVSLNDILYGMMLASGNDAANTAAIVVGGSIENFVKLMNERAKELGLKDTSFETPSGLDGENHYTTAYELAIIASEALKNPDFAKAASSETAVLNYGNPPYLRRLTNHNRLLKTYDDIIGVKTGFTKKSGRCLVSAASKEGKTVIAVTLNDPNDWADHRKMLDYGLSKVTNVNITPNKQNNTVKTVGNSEENLEINIPSVDVSALDIDGLSYKISLPAFCYTSIKKGDKVGSVDYYYNDRLIISKEITAKSDVDYIKPIKQKEFIEIFKIILSKV